MYANDDTRVNLQSLLYSYYIKYDQLLTLSEQAGLGQLLDRKLDIYIDLYDMLKPIYRRPIYADSSFVIVSSIINLAAHMRGFYWTRYGIQTRIYLVYGAESTLNHKQFYENFGNNKLQDSIDYEKNNFFINSQLDLMKILVAYIEGVYFIKRETNFCMFCYDNMVKNPDIKPLVITKSKYAYQLPAFIDECILMRPLKQNSMDYSFNVFNINVLELFFESKNEKTKQILKSINPKLISMIVALNGASCVNMKAACNITTAAKMIKKTIDNNLILNDYISDPDFLYAKFKDPYKYIDQTSFKFRFNAFDLVFQHRIYNSTAEARDITWIVDLHDPDTVKYIASRYFMDNPLDLNNL